MANRSGEHYGDVGARHRPLRVCHLAYTFYSFDNRVLRYAESLAQRGDEVDVISLRYSDDPWLTTLRGVRVFQIQRRSLNERSPWIYFAKVLWFLLKSTVLLTALQLRRRYDVV